MAARLFTALGEKKIYVNMIVQTTAHRGRITVSFTVLKSAVKEALAICEGLKGELDAAEIECCENISIVSAVGVGMLSSYGVAAKIFSVLAEENINIELISTSEIGISCVVASKYTELALKVLHKAFVEEEL